MTSATGSDQGEQTPGRENVKNSSDPLPLDAESSPRKSARVSVIMIFLDAERFIEEAIRSVLAQTYTDWELLLVNDGSSDASADTARRLAEDHPHKVRYLQHPGGRNRGMSASRNLGIRCASGEYIAFLDADDVYLPDKLARQVAILDQRPEAAMVYGPSLLWYSWNPERATRTRDRLRPLGVRPQTLVEPPQLLPLFLRRQAYTPATCGVLLRRDAALSVSGFEESFRGMFEDQVLFYKVCAALPVYIDGISGDRYRQTPESHSSRMRKSGFYRVYGPSAAYGRFLEWLEAYLMDHDCTNREIRRVLNRELRPYRSRLHYVAFVALQPVEKLRRTFKRWLDTRER